MSIERIRQDILYLAGRLTDRLAQSEEEMEAAHYIEVRLQEHLSTVEIETFGAIDNQDLVTASYLSEFFIVALLALWWPLPAAAYGALIFFAYSAEQMGYPVFSRLLPSFESANVVARRLAEHPKRLVVVTAHFDSPCATPFTSPIIAPYMRFIRAATLACMLLIVASCVAEGMAGFVGGVIPGLPEMRWAAVTLLMGVAGAHFINAMNTVEVRGANCNASGAAALLRIAEKIAEQPNEDVDVWIAATGAHERWMAGMRRLATELRKSKAYVHIINVECVGLGRMCYTTSEGTAMTYPCDPELLAAAAAEAGAHGFEPVKLRNFDTAAHIPLARGFKVMSLVGLDANGIPCHWRQESDTLSVVDEHAIARAADFAHAIIMRLGSDMKK